MKLSFVKMHGIGNDFIMVDATQPNQAHLLDIARKHAVELCDCKFGIGGDGVIVALPAPDDKSDFRMVVINSDGSEPEMCGNGLRCFAKFVHDTRLTDNLQLRVLTGRGVLTTDSTATHLHRIDAVQVNMGAPILARQDVPVVLPGDPNEPVIDEVLTVDGKDYRVTCVSMGNPHCVVFVDQDPDTLPLAHIGPLFESHPMFPKKINTEFVQVLDRETFKMRVWERGAGETLACGTGACAVAVAGVLTGKMDRKVTGHLAGGDLTLDWTEAGPVLMTGAATEVFTGIVTITE